MSELPHGWTDVALSEIADVQLGKMLDRKRTDGTRMPYLRNVNIRWERIDIDDLLSMPFKDGERDRYAVRPGDVLVCEGGEPGRAAVWSRPESAIMYQKALHRVRLPSEISPAWLVHQLRLDSFNGVLAKDVTGSTIGHLPLEVFRRYRLRIAPAHQQLAILDALDSYNSRLDATVATLNRARNNLKRYRASVLKAAVEGRLVPSEAQLARVAERSYEPASVLLRRIEEERHANQVFADRRTLAKGPIAPNLSSLAELPEGWSWTTVDAIADDVTYGSSRKASAERTDGVPVLRMGNIVDGSLDWSSLKYLPADHDEFPKLFVKRGDLLFNRTNSAELVGKCTVFGGKPNSVSFASYLIRVRFADGIQPEYIAAFINSSAGRDWVAKVASQQVGQANVNGPLCQYE